uniref:Uncharacterized protein n=1 Tax=Aegilops tauschii subsp. strangulata TaxID=200361 RepID=A0A453IFZ2_AEGTS
PDPGPKFHPKFHRRGRGDPDSASATMAYVERGVVKGKRTIWRLSIILDFFKAIVNFIRMFFLTMFSVSDQN